MKKPDLRLAIAINQRIRSADEWLDEPDELDRIESALLSIEGLVDPVEAAGVLAFRVTRAQGFAEGNKRTALLLAKWILDNNDYRSRQIIDPEDRHSLICWSELHRAKTSNPTSFDTSPTAPEPNCTCF